MSFFQMYACFTFAGFLRLLTYPSEQLLLDAGLAQVVVHLFYASAVYRLILMYYF